MNIANKISRLELDRNIIRDALVRLGIADSSDNLDTLAEIIENIANRGAISVTVKEGETYTIPAGYHNGSGTVSGVAGGGSYNLQSKAVTPTKKQQNVTPDDGYYGLSDVTVAAIPGAYQDVTSVTAGATDVMTGKIIVLADGTVVAGTMTNNGSVAKTLDATIITYTIPKGFHDGTGTVSIMLETKTVTPTKAQQKITPTAGKVLSEVTVAPIPDAYQDVTPVTAGAADVLAGKKIVTETGEVIDGAIPVNGDVSNTIDGLNTTYCTIPAGHTTGGTVSLTNDIEDALEAIVGGENTGIQREIASLAESKEDIAAAIESKGVTVPATTKLDGMAALIGQIQQGGTSVEKYTGTIKSLGESVDVYYTDGNTLAGNSGGVWADMGVPSESITIAKGTYITVVGSRSTTLAGKNVGYLASYYIDVTGQYVHIAEPNGDNFEIIGG